MITAVCDTNVVVSGLTSSVAVLGQIVRSWLEGDFRLVVSEPLLDEVTRTLAKPYFRRQHTPEQVERLITLLRYRATFVELTVPVAGIARHREDDLILATAINGVAEYLITHDRHFLRVRQYKQVRVLKPADFLAVLKSNR